MCSRKGLFHWVAQQWTVQLTSVLFWFLIYFTSPPLTSPISTWNCLCYLLKDSQGRWLQSKGRLAQGKMEGTLQESRNVEFLLWLAQGAGEEVSCLKMSKVNKLHCCSTMELSKHQKQRQKKESELLEAHTCEQQGSSEAGQGCPSPRKRRVHANRASSQLMVNCHQQAQFSLLQFRKISSGISVLKDCQALPLNACFTQEWLCAKDK